MVIQLRSLRFLFFAGVVALCVSTAFAISNVRRAIVSRVAPTYPELARRMHVGGKVVLLVTILPDGSVSSTKVQSGHALLVQAAQEAVTHWKFAPNPETSESEIGVNFTFDGQ